MSLAIRHPFMPWPLSCGAAERRALRSVEATSPRRDRAEPAGPSLFHRLAAADVAARDLAFPLFLNPARR